MAAAKKKKKAVLIIAGVVGTGLLVFAVYRIATAKKRREQREAEEAAALQAAAAAGGTAPAGTATAPAACTASGALDPKAAGVPDDTTLKNPAFLRQVLSLIKNFYGEAIAENVERIFRLETSNFTSGQYLRTGSAGMLKAGSSFPYGWRSLQKLWTDTPAAAPVGSVRFCVWNKDKGKFEVYTYLAFSEGWGLWALAEVLKQRGNNVGSWYSTIPAEQQKYANDVLQFNPQYV